MVNLKKKPGFFWVGGAKKIKKWKKILKEIGEKTGEKKTYKSPPLVIEFALSRMAFCRWLFFFEKFFAKKKAFFPIGVTTERKLYIFPKKGKF